MVFLGIGILCKKGDRPKGYGPLIIMAGTITSCILIGKEEKNEIFMLFAKQPH